ncbi:MAG: hypothetical protein ACM3PR_04255 [Bacteroidales bacterium]
MKTSFLSYKPRFQILMVILVVVLTMIGCVKDQQDSTIFVKIDNSLHPILFNKGSYWVYTMVPLKADTLKTVPKDSLTPPKDSIVYVRDSTNIMHDSISVESIEKDTLYITGNVRYYEYYRIHYHSSLENSFYDEQLIGYVISRGLNEGGFLLLSSKKKGDKSKNAEITDIFDELKIEDKTYKNVVKMKVLKDQFIKDNYFLYYVDNVGIVRKEKVVDNKVTETWNLIKDKVSLLKDRE